MKNQKTLQHGERFFAWVLLALSLLVLLLSYRISGFKSVSSPGAFPMAAAAVMAAAMVSIVIGNRKVKKPTSEGLKEELRLAARDIFFPTFLIYTGIIVAYMVLIEPLQFVPGSFAFLAVSMVYLKGSSPLKSVIISAGTMALIYLIFSYLFRVVLP
ncbi:MAG: tripartite tricarboxylate transporter TctB family protein [Desulfobacteraceae bacterium]|nr:MAG: tripartite tricarboxylate transporter TctB family protein [Desulfobacteraceae bacterium]